MGGGGETFITETMFAALGLSRTQGRDQPLSVVGATSREKRDFKRSTREQAGVYRAPLIRPHAW